MSAGVDQSDDDLFRAHFEKLPGAAFLWRREDGEFRVVAHNAAGARFGNDGAPRVIGRTLQWIAEFDPEFPDYLRRAAESGEILEKEDLVRFETGGPRQIFATFVPLSADLVVVHGRDVTDERETERQLRDSEARFRALIESSPDSIMRMDVDARILYAHFPESHPKPPWSVEQMIGRTVGDFFGPKANEQQVALNRAAIRTGETQFYEVRIPSEHGGLLHLECHVHRINDNEVVVTLRDGSERTELEGRKLLRDQQELGRLSREIHDGLAQVLTGANLRLEQVARSLGDEGSPHSHDVAEVTELIRQAVGQARQLSHGLSPVPQGTSLFEALRFAARLAEREFGVSCHLRKKGSDGAVGPVATTYLHRIAAEAMANAVSHGAARKIDLVCTIDDDYLALTIADDGRGLAAEEPELEEGIGLRIMRRSARTMAGDLKLGNRDDGPGAVVECTCPLRALSQ